MANWQSRLNIGTAWRRHKAGKTTLAELAMSIAGELQSLKPISNEPEGERESLIEQFLCFANDDCDDVEDFDGLMEQLYDWADTPLDNEWPGKKVCWVETTI